MYKKIKKRHLQEVVVYGLVGLSALAIQSLIYILLCRGGVTALIATFAGNSCGMLISYFGHTVFTFKKRHTFSRREFVKFIITNFTGLALNSLFAVLLVDVMHTHYSTVLYPQALITPLVTFVISKFWVFK